MSKAQSPSELMDEHPKRAIVKGLTCGQCDHLKHSAYFNTTCDKLGQQEFSTPCKAFTVSPLSLNIAGTASLRLEQMLRNASNKEVTAMAAILSQEHITRKHGFTFGQKIIIKLFTAGTHLNHFAFATVIKADAKLVYCQGLSGFRASMFHDSVLTVEEFLPLQQKMLKAGKISDKRAESIMGKTDKGIVQLDNMAFIEQSGGYAEGSRKGKPADLAIEETRESVKAFKKRVRKGRTHTRIVDKLESRKGKPKAGKRKVVIGNKIELSNSGTVRKEAAERVRKVRQRI